MYIISETLFLWISVCYLQTMLCKLSWVYLLHLKIRSRFFTGVSLTSWSFTTVASIPLTVSILTTGVVCVFYTSLVCIREIS